MRRLICRALAGVDAVALALVPASGTWAHPGSRFVRLVGHISITDPGQPVADRRYAEIDRDVVLTAAVTTQRTRFRARADDLLVLLDVTVSHERTADAAVTISTRTRLYRHGQWPVGDEQRDVTRQFTAAAFGWGGDRWTVNGGGRTASLLLEVRNLPG